MRTPRSKPVSQESCQQQVLWISLLRTLSRRVCLCTCTPSRIGHFLSGTLRGTPGGTSICCFAESSSLAQEIDFGAINNTCKPIRFVGCCSVSKKDASSESLRSHFTPLYSGEPTNDRIDLVRFFVSNMPAEPSNIVKFVIY